jgi:hypothetical protein
VVGDNAVYSPEDTKIRYWLPKRKDKGVTLDVCTWNIPSEEEPNVSKAFLYIYVF